MSESERHGKAGLHISGNAISYTTIIIDGDFIAAATGDDGSYS
jgi:hypothetical protein